MTQTANELYDTTIRFLPVAERLRLTALLLDDLRTLPTFSSADTPTPPAPRPRPVFGSGRNDISYMADDFDAPLEDMREYME